MTTFSRNAHTTDQDHSCMATVELTTVCFTSFISMTHFVVNGVKEGITTTALFYSFDVLLLSQKYFTHTATTRMMVGGYLRPSACLCQIFSHDMSSTLTHDDCIGRRHKCRKGFPATRGWLSIFTVLCPYYSLHNARRLRISMSLKKA